MGLLSDFIKYRRPAQQWKIQPKSPVTLVLSKDLSSCTSGLLIEQPLFSYCYYTNSVYTLFAVDLSERKHQLLCQ